jgi:DNA-binding response OmpR family regulator
MDRGKVFEGRADEPQDFESLTTRRAAHSGYGACLPEGSRIRGAAVKNGRDALVYFHNEHPDLVMLDVMMPGAGRPGSRPSDPARERRADPVPDGPRVDDTDRIAGLEIGADEYVTKPFSPRVLVAQVAGPCCGRAYGDLAAEPALWRVGELELNAETRIVTLGGPADRPDSQRIRPAPGDDDFAGRGASSSRGWTCSNRIQGEAYAAYERTIDVHVKNLRAKIEADPRQPQYNRDGVWRGLPDEARRCVTG